MQSERTITEFFHDIVEASIAFEKSWGNYQILREEGSTFSDVTTCHRIWIPMGNAMGVATQSADKLLSGSPCSSSDPLLIGCRSRCGYFCALPKAYYR
jgi:hypothetical protein